MARIPKPWKRTSDQNYYVTINRVRHKLGPKKREAMERYSRLLLARGLTEPGAKVSLHALVGRYNDWLRENRPPSTVRPRQSKINSLLAHFPARTRADDVKPYQVEEWARSPNKRTGAKPSPTTVHDRIRFVMHVYNRGVKMGLLAKNVLSGMDAPEPLMRRVFIPPERFPELFAAIDNDETRDFVTFMLESGARAAEMFDIKCEYFDAENRRIIMPIDESKGRKRQRVLHLNDTAMAIATRLVETWQTGAMFRKKDGKPVSSSWATYQFTKLKKAMKIPELCATCLRHSFAFARLTAGQNPVVVAKLMGHKDTRMVATRYGHLEESPLLAEKANEIELSPPKRAEENGQPIDPRD